MYYGKMTKELEELYKEYNKKWGVDPDFYEDTEYGDYSYEVYVDDIKEALRLGVALPELYPDDDEY